MRNLGLRNSSSSLVLWFDSEKEEEIRVGVESIKVRLGIQGELKSSKLNKRPDKRIDILTALSELDVRYVCNSY